MVGQTLVQFGQTFGDARMMIQDVVVMDVVVAAVVVAEEEETKQWLTRCISNADVFG